jgi:P4 family phage/plasmid primase-like protien
LAQTSTSEPTANGMGEFLRAAKRYREQEFALVPTVGKDAFVRGWQNQGTPPEDDEKHWGNSHARNIGIVLGAPSGGLVDIDRDCDLPARVEKMFLPDTLMSGRKRRPHTHSWYYSNGVRPCAFFDANGKKFLEVRADGHQTVVAPSKHPDGDRYCWHSGTNVIATVDPETLTRAIREYATALLLAIHIPPEGSRHDYALAAAGFLLRDGRLDADTVLRIFLGAWRAQRADKPKTVKELEAVVFDTAEKLESGEEVKGGSALGDLVEGLPKRISRIWGWGRHKPEDVPASEDGPAEDPDEVGIIKVLADAITKEDHFARDAGGKLYRFADGVYKSRAELYVKQRVQQLLEAWGYTKRWSSRRGEETTEYIALRSPELWERPPLDEINVKNGILNITTRHLRPHDPAFLSTVRIPVAYDPEATCPEWDKFVSTTFPEDTQVLAYELPADLMTPERSIQKSILLIGEGSNGKSTYLTAVSNFVGSTNIVGLSLQKMESDRFSASRLLSKLANICPDLPSSHLAGTSMFKAVTGGDAINAEYKYRESFEFRPFVRLVFSANQVPRSEDASHAFFRRWLVVPFDRTFEDGEQIPRQELDARLSDPRELSGVLNRALNALPSLRQNGFTESASMQAAWQEFRAMTDPVSVWLDKNTVTGPEAFVAKDALLQAYNNDEKNAGRIMTMTAFTQAIKRLRPDLYIGQKTVNGKVTRVWVGIGLISPDGGPPEQGPGTRYTEASTSQLSQVSQLSQLSSNCLISEETPQEQDNDGEEGQLITNKGKLVKVVKVVNAKEPSVNDALEALRYGNAPRKVMHNVLEGTQTLPDLARSVMNFYGAKCFDGWEEWLEPVVEAFDRLTAEDDAKGGAA